MDEEDDRVGECGHLLEKHVHETSPAADFRAQVAITSSLVRLAEFSTDSSKNDDDFEQGDVLFVWGDVEARGPITCINAGHGNRCGISPNPHKCVGEEQSENFQRR